MWRLAGKIGGIASIDALTWRELDWAWRAREQSYWDVAKFIIAKLEQCRTHEAKDIEFDTEAWNWPVRREELAKELAEKQRAEAAARGAAHDPAALAELKRIKQAQWNNFLGAIITIPKN